MAEAALQMAVMAVLSVRSDGEYRNATAAETTSLIENTYVAQHPDPLLCVLILDGVSCHVGGLKRFHGWTFSRSHSGTFAFIKSGTWKGQSKHWNGLLGNCTRSILHCRTSCVTGHEHKQ